MFPQVSDLFLLWLLTMCGQRRSNFLLDQHSKTHKKRFGVVYDVLVCDPKTQANHGLTMATEAEAETLKRLLDANGQSFEIAQSALLSNEARVPAVAEVIRKHIDLLARLFSGATRTCQVMLNLHIRNIVGHIPVDKLDYCHLNHWVKSMLAKDKASKMIHNVHGLISAARNTAEQLGNITSNPCRGEQLPPIYKAEDEAHVPGSYIVQHDS